MEILIGVLVAMLAGAIAGVYVARQKNRSVWEGVVFGLCFGPLGVLIVACLPEGQRREPRERAVKNESALPSARLTGSWE